MAVGIIVAGLMWRHVMRHVGRDAGAVLIPLLFGGAFLLMLMASRRAMSLLGRPWATSVRTACSRSVRSGPPP